jgi:hypothetical protein
MPVARRIPQRTRGPLVPTFYGSILRDTGKEILFSIAVDRGDARSLGLCGQVWFAKRQLIQAPREEDGYDVIKVPYAVAIAKARTCELCE